MRLNSRRYYTRRFYCMRLNIRRYYCMRFYCMRLPSSAVHTCIFHNFYGNFFVKTFLRQTDVSLIILHKPAGALKVLHKNKNILHKFDKGLFF